MSLPEQREIKSMNRKDTRDMEIVHHPQHLQNNAAYQSLSQKEFFS